MIGEAKALTSAGLNPETTGLSESRRKRLLHSTCESPESQNSNQETVAAKLESSLQAGRRAQLASSRPG
ncbi:MAG TPA: hypothetical protein PKL67_04820 [Anaerolineae bacterium]|nr:hypothetical protein [Anaerolineae bacterium]